MSKFIVFGTILSFIKNSSIQCTDFGKIQVNIRLRIIHRNFLTSFYFFQDADHSSLLHALVTDERKIRKSLMNQIIKSLQCNDMISAMNVLVNERLKKGSNGNIKHFSMYRDLLYLSFVAMGRENIDQSKKSSTKKILLFHVF